MLTKILGLLLAATNTNAVSLTASAEGEISLDTSTEVEMGAEQYGYPAPAYGMMPNYGTTMTYKGTPQQNMSYRDYAFYYKNGYTR